MSVSGQPTPTHSSCVGKRCFTGETTNYLKQQINLQVYKDGGSLYLLQKSQSGRFTKTS